jgi:hypothetical protein
MLNETTELNITLSPAVSGEVTVTSEAEPINTSNAQIAQSLTSTQIIERPVANQTNFLTLAETFTGFQENPTSGQKFNQNQALNAKSYFAHGDKPVFRRNQYGFAAGFPVWRNKFFGFASLDHRRDTGANLFQRDLPTEFEQNPANWFALAPENDTPGNRAFIEDIMTGE